MALKFIAGTPEQAAARERKIALSSRREDKWVSITPANNDEVPPSVALPPFIKISYITKNVAASYDGSWIESVDEDRNIRTRNTTITYFLYTLSVQYRTSIASPVITWTSLNTNVATINSTTGELTYVSDGNVIITAEINGTNLIDQVTLNISSETGGSITEFVSFVTGALAHHCENAINSRIEGASTSVLPIFSTQNHTTQTYIRNSSCWAYDLRQQMTCISPWNSTGGATRAGTLITPRHIIFAAHYELSVGATVRFVAADNTVITRTMVGRLRHPSYSPYYPDLTIGVLDSDVPASIDNCLVLPSNYGNYFPTGPKNVAALCLDQQEKALVTDLYNFSSTFVSFAIPNLPDEKILYESKVVGDSGNPAFLIINDQLVLITVWTSGGAGSGTFITPQISNINQMIVDLDASVGNGGTGYTLTTVDLSGFIDFS